jgi:hypothetical protein
MTETNEKERSAFLGTYFDKNSVLRFARLAEILAWVVLGYHAVQIALSLLVFGLQVSRGLYVPAGPTDLLQQIVWQFQPLVPGALYFVIIQLLGKLALIFMDIEDNTRRAARNK